MLFADLKGSMELLADRDPEDTRKLLDGEPGVGKSRLFWEFTHSHRTAGCLIVEAASASYGEATAYYPVIELLKG